MAKEVILPSLPPLTEAAKKKLIMIADTYAKGHKENILHYLETGEITIEELPLLDRVPEIKEWLIREYNAWRYPADPLEQSARAALLALLPASPEALEMFTPENRASLESALRTYIDQYEESLPSGNIIEEAREYLDAIRRIAGREAERREWEGVDYLSYSALMEYLRRHPDTPFFSELDDRLWDLVNTTPVNIHQVRQFISDMPRSAHMVEAQRITAEFNGWEDMKSRKDLVALITYVKDNPYGAFLREALQLINELKAEKMETIKKNPSKFSKYDLDDWLRTGQFTENELIEAGVSTRESLETLREVSEFDKELSLEKKVYDCPPGSTDVYFLGIPSTGKTCILMGLLNTQGHLDWNSVQYGGQYGSSLQHLCDVGITPTRTIGNFATLISGSIRDFDREGVVHKVNLIEMAGEAFAEQIAMNPDSKVTIKDLGAGIPEMLSNDNEKVFFIVIDPTTDVAKYRKEKKDDFGKVNYMEVSVPQKKTMHMFLSILSSPENASIMRKVRGLYIIATKADCLGPREKREEIASAIVRDSYGQSVYKLAELCEPDVYDINALTNNELRVFPFSLGTFYVGGVFKYDPTDSDHILRVVSRLAAGARSRKTWFDRIRDWFNS